MKKQVLLLSLFVLTGLAAHAETLAPEVLAQYSTNVGFAPPEHRGIFRFQILKSGVVQDVDNKGNIKYLAQLSNDLVQNLARRIDAIATDELKKPADGPICADVPLTKFAVQRQDGSTMIIATQANCVQSEPVDHTAHGVYQSIRALKIAMDAVSRTE